MPSVSNSAFSLNGHYLKIVIHSFSMETGRLDTFYFDRLANRVSFRTSGKLLNCFLFCHTDMPQ